MTSAVRLFWQSPRMLIGYARVSTDDQDASLQVDALEQAGCERIFVDHASGALRERPQLTRALEDLRDSQDVLVDLAPRPRRTQPATPN